MTKELVLIGGGHAHVHVLKMLGVSPYREILQEKGIKVTLVTNCLKTPYSGMLPGYVAGHYTFDDIHLDLEKICRFSGIRLVHSPCREISCNANSKGGWIHCDDNRPPIRYDVASLDVGSTPGSTNPSILGHPKVISVKPISDFCRYYGDLQQRFSDPTFGTASSKLHRIAVVGGGAGGVELILSLQTSIEKISREKSSSGVVQKIQMVLVTRGSVVLQQSNRGVQKIMSRILQERGIQVHLNSAVEGIVDREQLSYLQVAASANKKGDEILFDDCFWCINVQGAGWLLQNTPFPCNDQGFVMVESSYQVLDHPGVFAVGDCAHSIEHPRPKAGVFAVRAGPPLLENIMASILGKEMTPHIPQSQFLSIISTGNKYAIASRGHFFSLEGYWVWKWKDWIDR